MENEYVVKSIFKNEREVSHLTDVECKSISWAYSDLTNSSLYKVDSSFFGVTVCVRIEVLI